MEKGLSLILTCFNEEKYLLDSYIKVKKELVNLRLSYEMIFVDDGSHDRTLEIIKSIKDKDFRVKYIAHKENIGRGQSVADGILVSKYEFVGFIDLDLEISEKYIGGFIKKLKEGYDLVIGNRRYSVDITSFHRFIASKGYIFLKQFLLSLPFKDGGASYKFFRKSKILPILSDIKEKRWFWDTELLARSYYKDLKIHEITVNFVRRKDKKSAVKLIRDSTYFFRKITEFKKELGLPYFLFWKLLVLYSKSPLGLLYVFLKYFAFPFKTIEKELPKSGNIVDLGCGEGVLSNILFLTSPNRRILGIDLSSERLSIASSSVDGRSNLKFAKENILDYDFPKIDGAVSSDFLHHLSYKEQEFILSKVYFALNAKGVFVIKEIDKKDRIRAFMSLVWDWVFYPKDKVFYRSKTQWEGLSKKIGFKVRSKSASYLFPGSTRIFTCIKNL